MLRFIRAVGLALGTVTLVAASAVAGEYQCRQNDSALRIAVEVKKAGHTLPCEVIAEDDRNERAVLYSAQYDRNYCPERLEKTRAELEGEGWVCEKTSDTNVVQGTSKVRPPSALAASERAPVVPSSVAISDSRSCRLNEDVRRIRIEVEDLETGRPCALIYWSENDKSEAGQLLWRAEYDAEFCTKRLGFITRKWTNEGWRCAADQGVPQEAALPVEDVPQAAIPASTTEPASPSPPPPPEVVQQPAPASIEINPKLQAVIEADARRIGEWMEVEPGIEVAAYGDLNADNRDDAVIFLAYRSDQAAYRQYLMSYLVVDETYELAGVKLLTGVNPPPAQAKVEQIDDGVIWISLPGEDGTRQDPIGYMLRDQQLVEVDISQQAESRSN